MATILGSGDVSSAPWASRYQTQVPFFRARSSPERLSWLRCFDVVEGASPRSSTIWQTHSSPPRSAFNIRRRLSSAIAFPISIVGLGQPADHYFVLKDLQSYYETQRKVEDLYLQPELWAEYAIHNVAAMGEFSSDVSILNYAEKIWGLEPSPPDENILARVRHAYSEHDRCRVLVF